MTTSYVIPAGSPLWRLPRYLALLVAGAAWWPVLTGPGSVGLAILASVLCLALLAVAGEAHRKRREHFLRHAPLPRHLRGAVRKTYPHLQPEQLALVEKGLRQFFVVWLHGRDFVAMPSQVVDRMWHEFILDTAAYREFCHRGFGRFLDHKPAATLDQTQAGAKAGLRHAWQHACRSQGIDPARPTALPLLFALDAQLAIPDGFRYSLDCREFAPDDPRATYCATALDGSGCGGGTLGGGCAGDGGGGDGGGGGCGGGCGGGGGD
ncbi:hypothetical protein OOT46_00925 [Aquabacterium sp. A7-Y]|uniref:glycine-rich domain-containing protein n=1 Tax=Aquabacterium sp. A7-Y TaxID=1349605 RepID=UPI00223D752C|nr:hypothetical protein [Aquabacterium sp. A7-Y]MCW7536417.1 hypothetical protein [Aquabacterium sp. A7-Y]